MNNPFTNSPDIKSWALAAFFLMGSFVSLSALAQTTVYQCKDQLGRPIFSQRPCGDAAKKVDIDVPQPSGDGSSSEESDNVWEGIAAANDVRSLNRLIEHGEVKVRKLEKDRNQKLSELEKQRAAISNEDGTILYYRLAALHAKLSAEISDVRRVYNQQIDEENDSIHQARLDLIDAEAVLRTPGR